MGTQDTLTASFGGPWPWRSLSRSATAGVPDSLVIVSGNAQMGVVGGAALAPLIVRVADQHGNPVDSAAVTWVDSTGGGIAPHDIGTGTTATTLLQTVTGSGERDVQGVLDDRDGSQHVARARHDPAHDVRPLRHSACCSRQQGRHSRMLDTAHGSMVATSMTCTLGELFAMIISYDDNTIN